MTPIKPPYDRQLNALYFAPIGDVEMKPLQIAENSIRLPDDESATSRELTKPITLTCSCSFEPSENLINAYASEIGNIHSDIIIEDIVEHIGKPKNLKYPNKKRSRRIWKKWAKLYGMTLEHRTLCLPDVEMVIDETDEYRTIQINPNQSNHNIK